MTADLLINLFTQDGEFLNSLCIGKNFAYWQFLKAEELNDETDSFNSNINEITAIMKKYSEFTPRHIKFMEDLYRSEDSSTQMVTIDLWQKMSNFIKEYAQASPDKRLEINYVGSRKTLRGNHTVNGVPEIPISKDIFRSYYWYNRKTHEFSLDHHNEIEAFILEYNKACCDTGYGPILIQFEVDE